MAPMMTTNATSATIKRAHAFDFDKSKPDYGVDIFLVCLLVLVFVGCLAGLLLVDLGRKWTGSLRSAAAVRTARARVEAPAVRSNPEASGGGALAGLPKVDGFSYSPTRTTTPPPPPLPQSDPEVVKEGGGEGEASTRSVTEAASSVDRASLGRKHSRLKSMQTPGYRVESMVDLAFR